MRTSVAPVLCAVLALSFIFAIPAAAQVELRVVGEPVLLIGGEDNAFSRPAWSPDGEHIAFTRPGYHGLWVLDAEGQAVRQLSDEPAAGFGFSWSPGGDALLARVARFEGPRRLNAVKVIDVETGQARQLTEYRPRMPVLPQWSADGEAVVLAAHDRVEVLERAPTALEEPPSPAPLFVGRDGGLAVVRDAAGTPRVEHLLEGERVLNAVASPDRSKVAFEIMGGDLYVMNADGSGLVTLGPGHRPAWSPDGEWVAFMRTEDDGHHFTASDLYAAAVDGSRTVALTQTVDRLEMNPSWSPDGGSIAFDDLADGAIYLLPVSY